MSGDPLAWLDQVARSRQEANLERVLVPRAPRFEHEGRRLVNFASNDYLGLAGDPRLAEAAAQASARFGWGAGASPLVSGWSELHQELADALAAFEGTDAAVVFPSGFAANLGTIAALVGPGDAVYLDRLNHACLVDGARLAGARLRVYPHNDAERLGEILDRDRSRFRRALIATDGVFSMDGDLAPLPVLVDLAESHGAMLLVDEAHGTGVHGPDGRGAGSALGIADRIPIKIGTLSKALGSVGGFVAGSRRLIDHLINHARPLIYSTALPPAAAAAALAALRVVAEEPWRRDRVHALADRLRAGLGVEGVGPIVPFVVGSSEAALELSSRLLDQGILAPAIRPPTVPRGTARLRLSVTAGHAEAEIDRVIAAMIRGTPCAS